MMNRIAYLVLVVGLYALGMAGIVGAVAWVFDRPFFDVALNLSPALIIFFGVAVYHGLRHDLTA
ncbi:MAG: hypothetical protein ACTHZ5_00300 [Micrococcaceae bacterium]